MPSRPRKPVRRPVQERARLRRESILDATARLLDREGYDALTTNAVAREAGTAIGTVYEYFPHREALLRALLARHAERLAAVIEPVGSMIVERDPLAIGDALVEAFARFWVEEPGYRSAWAIGRVSGLLLEEGAAWGDRFGRDVARLLGAIAPQMRRRDRQIVAWTVVHLVSGLLQAAIESGTRTRARIEETKLVLRAYLSARVPNAAARPRSAK